MDLDSNILVTYPRDEVRKLHLYQTIKINGQKQLSLKVASEKGKVWGLTIYIDDTKVLTKVIEGMADKNKWEEITVDLTPYQGQEVKIRMFQNVMVDESLKTGSSAYWKDVVIK
ncbi:MAG: hypothetical protein WKF91_07270 [Segetibacter sp.]